MKHHKLLFMVLFILFLSVGSSLMAQPTAPGKTPPPAKAAMTSPSVVELPSANSPLVSFRILIHAGSINDPQGKEGLNALTALMIGQGGTRDMTYKQIVDTLYPWAASIAPQSDKEVTVFIANIHKDNLLRFYRIFADLLLQPRFDESDFKRNKDELLNYLQNTLRFNDDEDLGKQSLEAMLYANHPYGHTPEGTVEGLKSITLDDVKAYYKKFYTRDNITLGIAGGYRPDFIQNMKTDFAKLPAGRVVPVALPKPAPIKDVQIDIVKKENRAIAISFGCPVDVTRADKDFYALMVASSYLGEHRTQNGVLFNYIRGLRGLNYGDYAYVENFIQDGGSTFPVPNIPRRQQFFSVWIRPVEPQNAHFALRAALYQVQQLVRKGLTQEQFEQQRKFLLNYSKLWNQTLSRRLGTLLDSKFYGIEYFPDRVERELKALKVEEVNAAVKKHLQDKNFDVAIITRDAEPLKTALAENQSSPIKYAGPVSGDVLRDDKVLVDLKLTVNLDKLRIVPSSELFEK
ncbi:MAG: insulinase family protein [Acidobacteriia bacterium]|nr:insulinase family protein [Terriglobia bacterium]